MAVARTSSPASISAIRGCSVIRVLPALVAIVDDFEQQVSVVPVQGLEA